jgi:alpha-amylase/alpha-mannosidase (GH57 family)
MSVERRLKVVLCWHMHQPEYRDLSTGEYRLPWTYLHAIKDYVDMAAHLEAVAGAKAVVNFAPLLLEQLDDYSARLRAHLERGEPLPDPMLAALEGAQLPRSTPERRELLIACLRANRGRMVDRFPAYKRLADLGRWLLDHDALAYAGEPFFTDLATWYHLAWLGETVRRQDTTIQGLIEQGSGYTPAQRRAVLSRVADLIAGVVPRYRHLAESGRVELAVSPYGHPIVPLLLDLRSARESMPECSLPQVPGYPGGEARARRHLQLAAQVFEQHFGFRPRGCWPSEGGVSDATLQLIEELGFEWVATGQAVLHHSLLRTDEPTLALTDPHRPYRVANGRLRLFARDDGLSDLIGFTYANWHADDAVANFIHHLETIAAHSAHGPERVVSIILDGENAWEYYPNNGFYFLLGLYRRLAKHPAVELTTFSAVLDSGLEPVLLPSVVAGSWVYGTFSTWIGDPDKNHGWELLCAAKEAYDQVLAQGEADLGVAERQLLVCEGSDWFWWLGDYNPEHTVRDFDALFRLHLRNFYLAIGREPPAILGRALSHGRGVPEAGGVMRRGHA